jgi:beta-lactamase class A
MALAHVGADRVRAFIASIGLRNTLIPTSLRQFVGYTAGLPDWQATTWAQIVADAPYPPRPAMNDECTLVSSPDDFVAFYPRALQGEFFRYPETLAAFRRILTLADAIAAMPLGVNAFLKGGSIDVNDYYALSIAGGMYLPQRWVYYTVITNWTSAEGGSIAEVEPLLIDTARTIFTLVRDRLGV